MNESYYIQGKKGVWELAIGLELHARVISNAKLFSGSQAAFGGDVNTQVSLVDAAMPGMLPVINRKCVEQAVRTSLALKAKINLHSVFERKHYFYADLPQGYQITQYKEPIASDGELLLDLPNGKIKSVKIERLQLEQDAGKLLHEQHSHATYVDLNRAGIALMEIVSKPDLSSPEEARLYVNKLRLIMQYISTCDGNMQEGSLRVDVNVSVRKPDEPLGTYCEIKNINSLRFIYQAIEQEANRQINILENGGQIDKETCLFDPIENKIKSMRSKENAEDYRYFKDPDLLPLVLDQSRVDQLKNELPELPDAKRARFISAFNLSFYDLNILLEDRANADWYEQLAEQSNNPKIAANWMISELFGALNKAGKNLSDSLISPKALSELVNMIENGHISGCIAKTVFATMFETGKSAISIVKEKNLSQTSDVSIIEDIIDNVLITHANNVKKYKDGKDKLFSFFVGETIKKSHGKANPIIVTQLLRDKLDS
ncbi:glutamyl-tRNA(Gln) and/or aspartyl-tRNA(Asn) amidotransferase, B subunit [Candidatus Endolissoclinum faulkneri L2]|uniref:Aspartyl/glutamyl-tRNA(Asn/Gln) amidotransferase subunit B n=1 Tax=Candidatus Endolissoclinum faulkneri L2 TaxID=1193729 RepID=K7YG42_9PROT|nr:Asp-tRNA(Asn)/Glu-tRNA(Gln) amidotransferase subunit GatB [Candidatus Endolissoclinum faulkneri]AFX98575.1 glutamyl-tRNA(Gln) and/or aspartyl-tRNA(Asn) amidotransferase, B subunit [Candidatus Endolissoclinum faulkneri L2]